jgi:hypothetical protein
MKIYNPIGSKERFLEIFQGVNKVKLNEVATNVMQTGTQLVEKAFEELKTGVAKIKQTNTQTVGDENFVEIITNDNEGNEITFRFKVSSTEGDQEDVYNVNNAALVEFKIKSATLNVDMPENMKAVQEFNQNHAGEIMDVVSEYASFETDTASVDEMYEEAIKLIDKVPYKKGTEQMQTNKAYADQKPTNSDVRVKSDELDKFVSEMQDFVDDAENDDYTQDVPMEDPLADPTEYSAADAAAILRDKSDDDGTKGIDPYDQFDVDDEGGEDVSPEEQALYTQAYDNLIAAGNQAPTAGQIDAEFLKLKREKGLAEPFKKIRAKPKEAEPFYEELGRSIVHDINADDAVQHGFEKTLSPEAKEQLIRMADNALTERLGVRKFQMSREQYVKLVRDMAVQIYRIGHTGIGGIGGGLNEEEGKEKGDYPDPIGKKFKPKNQMPKKKKKPQSVVKLSEESEIPKEYWGNPEDEINEQQESWETDIAPSNHEQFKQQASQLGISPQELYDQMRDEEAQDDAKRFGESDELPEPAIEPDFDAMGMEQDDGMSLEPQGDEIEQLSQEKEETGDMLAGGLADDKVAGEFDPEQLAMGLKVEMEHTDNPMVALEIAMDHLMEIPDYYTHLDKMEKEAGVEEPEGEEGGEDNELEDELLGYKPHNVNDYTSEEFDYAAAERDYHDKEDMRQHPEDYEDVAGEEEKEEIIDEEEGFEEYQGEIGDRYQDAEGNQFTVRDKVKGGVTLQGQGGEKEIATRDIGFLKKLSEEELVEMARQALNKRGLNEGMTKKEAVQILIKHNIK